MDKVQIIGVPQSTFVRAVRIAAEEMGIAYDLIPEPPHSPAVDALHPLGRVPVMRHGDFGLCESRAIITYFEHQFGGSAFIKTDARERAPVEQWVSMLITAMYPVLQGEYLLSYIFPTTPDGTPDRARIEAALPRVEHYLAVLGEEVAKTGFLGAESFSIADAYLIPILFYLSKQPESGALIEANGALRSYLARHDERPSVRATMPENISEEQRERAIKILSEATA
jgi:glutathione S-transferase